MDSTFLRPMTFNNHSALLRSLMVPINVAAELNCLLFKTSIVYFKEFSRYDCSADASHQSAFSFLR